MKTKITKGIVILTLIFAMFGFNTIQLNAQTKPLTIEQLTEATIASIGLGMPDLAMKALNTALEDNPAFKEDPAFLCLLSTIYIHKKDMTTAVSLLQKAAQLCTDVPCLTNTKKVMAEGLYLNEDFAGVLSAIDDLLKELPENPNIWFFSGASKFGLQQFSKAIPDLENAYNKKENDKLFLYESTCLAMLVNCGQQTKNDDVSEKYLNILITIITDSTRLSGYYQMLGEIYSNRAKMNEAIGAYEKSIAFYPTNMEAYQALAKSYLKNGNQAKADEIMNNLTKEHSADPEAYFQVGMYMLEQNNLAGAASNFDKAIMLEPTSSKYPGAASMAYEGIKDYNKAMQYGLKAVMIDPTNVWSNHNMGYLNALTKQWDQSIEWETKALAIDPKYDLALSVMAWAYLEKGDCTKAKDYSKQCIKVTQKDQGAFDMPYYYMAVCLEKEGEQERANGFYKIAASIGNPESKERLTKLGVSFGDWEEPARSYYEKASAEFSAKNYTEAMKYVELAEELTPNKDLVVSLKGYIYLNQGNADMALKVLLECLELNPNSPAVNLYVGYIYFQKSDKENSFKYFSIGASQGDEQSVAYLRSIGWKYYEAADYLTAAGFLAEADKYTTLEGADLYCIAYCYHMANELSLATQFYIKAARAGNESARTILNEKGISY